MAPLTRIAFIGNSLPRHCGIATFTSDLEHAVAKHRSHVDTAILAMTDPGMRYDYPAVVKLQVNEDKLAEYASAASWLNSGRFDVVCLQHEFGIYGGEAGGHLLALLSRLTVPLVTTLHTILATPTPQQRSVMEQIIAASSTVIVMAQKGRELLESSYAVPGPKIEIIAHGTPDCAFVEPDAAKAALGFSNKTIILTFGLLSPNKGIEVMIDALPAILQSRPDCIYVVLGATHPHLVRQEGEQYRESLMQRARDLGVSNQVVFLNRFVDQATLLEFISMCDVYVTPYLNEAQMTSGTLAYSFGMGKAVVSTPYWHAQELLADGRGILVPFGDVTAIGAQISALLTDEARREAMRRRAYAVSRPMTWERTAERYMDVFGKARRAPLRKASGLTPMRRVQPEVAMPSLQLGHLLSMCDDTGMLQHALWSVADRTHGYCIDDNARALLLACALNRPGEQRLPELVTARLAAFVQHAWNGERQRFRNFMSFERRWLEEVGSEDSHGRALWALGECARADANPSRRLWAAALFKAALPTALGFTSPRAWAFTLLGLDGYCAAHPKDQEASQFRPRFAERLMSILAAVESGDWVWFEAGLAYDNARLPQALLVTGVACGTQTYVETGLRSLRWLMTLQSAADGTFRPVGSQSFGEQRQRPRQFDQQPLEATATISACLAAWRASAEPSWKSNASQVFAWFLGSNDLSLPLIDLINGSCCDGLHADRVNQNRGAESAISYLLSLAEIRELARGTESLPLPAVHAALRTPSALIKIHRDPLVTPLLVQ